MYKRVIKSEQNFTTLENGVILDNRGFHDIITKETYKKVYRKINKIQGSKLLGYELDDSIPF